MEGLWANRCYSPSPVGSALEKTSPDVTPGGDHVARVDAEQVEDIVEDVELFAAIGNQGKTTLVGKEA